VLAKALVSGDATTDIPHSATYHASLLLNKCNDKPLCGSRNQEIVFFSNRYSPCDLAPQGYEVTISGDGGSAITTGFPPPNL